MSRERNATGLSGEIMSIGSRPDVLDAEFEIVANESASSRAGFRQRDDGQALSMLGAETASARTRGRRAGAAFWTAGMLCVFGAFWLSGGHALLRTGTAVPIVGDNSGLTISTLESRIDASGPRPILHVDGFATNKGIASAVLPTIELRVHDREGAVIRYKLGTASQVLAPGQRFAFSSRIEAPRNGVEAVDVGFLR